MNCSVGRSMTFAAMMQQECGWHDDENHSSAELSARLTGDAGDLEGVSTKKKRSPGHKSVSYLKQMLKFGYGYEISDGSQNKLY